MDQGVGILTEQAVVGGFPCQRDGIGFGFGAVSPAVEDDENKRFWARHKCGFYLLGANKSCSELGKSAKNRIGQIPWPYQIGSSSPVQGEKRKVVRHKTESNAKSCLYSTTEESCRLANFYCLN